MPLIESASVDGGAAPTLVERAVAVGLTVAGYALSFLLLGVATSGLLRYRPGRAVATTIGAAGAALVVALHLLGVVVRVLSGSFITVGAVEFCMNSWHHFAHAAFVGYPGFTLTWVGVCVAASLGAARYLHGAAEGAPAGSGQARLLFASGGGLGIVIALGAAIPTSSRLSEGIARTTPELAFVDSFDDGADVAQKIESEAPPKHPVIHVEPGPPLSSGTDWAHEVSAHAGDRPNVLLITLESISIRHLGYFGYPRNVTPNLDRIAAESMRMRRAWSTATHSNYAQPAILSSLFPRRTTGLDVYRRLDYPRFLFNDLLSRLGYATATITSQDEDWQGMRRFENTGTPQFFWDSHAYRGAHLDSGSERVVPDAKTVDEVIGWLKHNTGHRWGLYVDLQMTHFPYKLPPGTPEPYQPTQVHRGSFTYLGYPEADLPKAINRYDNALRYVDEQIGRIDRFLADSGLADRTLWVITADHGEMFFDHGMVTHGKTLYEGEARVPLLVHWPGHVKPADVDEPVSHLDIMPTVAELIGVPPHPSFQGTSFASPAEHAKDRTAIFINIQGLRSAEAIVCWPWKLVVERTGRQVHLFNLENDPAEEHDRVEKDLRVATALANTLETQMRAQVRYHKRGNPAHSERYAPRLLTCPALPGMRRVMAESR